MRPYKFLIAGALALVGFATAAQRTPLTPPVTEERVEGAQPTPTEIARAEGARALTREDVDAWLDGFLPYALGTGDIAGGVVVVVRDGQIVTQRGFGYANVEERRPVDPARTLFRPGSISKLFTWTAVMQLVEQGRIDLDADINRYLDFEIPARDGQPLTMRNLMTHRPGFEEQVKDIISTSDEGVIDYVDLLKRWTPERVYPAGETPAYSNYATSLAGYIVERVSGEPFDTYIERHIFQPLGMANSSFAQPLPARLQPMMATGYGRASGEVVPFEHVGPRPAGSLSATGTDMARFMVAHLNNGAGLLRPETARMMHTTAANGIGPLNRMLLGFYETNINGRRVIAHGGDTIAFHSYLHLFMDDNVGLYVSFNSSGRDGAVGNLRSAIFEQFANRYFPAPVDTRRVAAETAAEHARMMAGTWRTSRGSFSNFLRIVELLGQVKVGVDGDGQLVAPIFNGLNGQPRQWVEVEPFVWQDLNSHERLAAVVEDGRVVRWSIGGIAPIIVLDRVPWHMDTAWLMPALIASLLILFLTALFWPVRALVRRRFGSTLALERSDLRAYRASRIGAWAMLLAVVGWLALIAMLMGDLVNLSSGADVVIILLQIITWIAFFGGLAAMAWNLWRVWRSKRGWKAKAWSVALLLAAVIVIWVGFGFNMLDFGANY
ncbi:serine hydrolase domain-containing protein [Sphingosinicella terrae]|uniref:serine hydrolase domain-containing protein n=1 Tax=Sphingosinicella terrae TaxID=2172047 RepID=UPI000E0D9643|nr:serine hydrolase domain-containing protein [Sphingosinicella terrae]